MTTYRVSSHPLRPHPRPNIVVTEPEDGECDDLFRPSSWEAIDEAYHAIPTFVKTFAKNDPSSVFASHVSQDTAATEAMDGDDFDFNFDADDSSLSDTERERSPVNAEAEADADAGAGPSEAHKEDTNAAAVAVAESSPTTTNRRNKKIVRFSHLTVREFPIVLGDNPGAPSGPPLAIGWEPTGPAVDLDVDDYEDARERPPLARILKPSERTDMLLDSGYSRSEVQRGVRDANLSRGQRQTTKERLQLAIFEEMYQRATRKVLNATLRRSTKRCERALLAPYRKHQTK